ncbi:uncharacterized protein LY89DRAFT_691222 [Mollisia scopiformis]|uniref:Uncharacterized protein n=1 Tax=Mollisia scopiformis TaxID=149040 RepID=A0A132B7J5_MOLSC|nr:uncharacterized protein LY89DRAFT_691222 [Mollisia scopiformis]KUJ08372.1 hypothetical protein LY89DRAFT_691222 [Mollisia scopiformis]
MNLINFFDDLGIYLLCRPLDFIHRLQLLNLFDDMGIVLLIQPLGYLHRFADIVIRADEEDRTLDKTWPAPPKRRYSR